MFVTNVGAENAKKFLCPNNPEHKKYLSFISVCFNIMTMIIRRIMTICFVFLFVLLNCSLVYAHDPPPVASNVSINSGAGSISLTEGTTANVLVAATVTDANGCTDITGVTVKFYKTATGAGAPDDANNHYTVTTPTDVVQNSCVDLVATYTATIPVWYYADPAEWTVQVTPTDGIDGTASTDTITINTLIALSVTDTIAYGELALGVDTGITDKTTTITNTGNVAIGVQVDGYGAIDGDGKSMTCDVGSVTIGSEKYSKTAETAFVSKTALTDTAATLADFTIAQRIDGATTGNIYWGFGMPATGVSGTCSGAVVFTPL